MLMRYKLYSLLFTTTLIIIGGCQKEKEESSNEVVVAPKLKNDIPEFYKENEITQWGKELPQVKVVANINSRISSPNDLDFNPNRAGELWIVNEGTESTGGSTVMFTGLETNQQTFDLRKDENAWHFMSLPTAVAFSNNGDWAISPGVLDANHQGGTFTGPSLWSSDLSVYAMPSGGNGSHLDMLHGSPYSMGIASEEENVYWVFDGYNGYLCKYDFGHDHGPGNDDHSDGKIFRYKEVKLKKNKTVPSHLVLDEQKKYLYIVDGGNKRILRVNILTGSKFRNLATTNEPLKEHAEMTGVEWEVFYDQNLQNPCGIDLNGNRLFVSDFETGEIICIDINTKEEMARFNTGISGIRGIRIDAKNKLWFVSYAENTLNKIEPK
jgi:hypothetical protein